MKHADIVYSIIRVVLLGILMLALPAQAVTSVITRQNQSEDFLKGKIENIMIDSDGTLRLARKSETVIEPDSLIGVWTINTLLAESGGAVYCGTSPNGTIFKYSGQEIEVLYPTEMNSLPETDPNTARTAPIRNEHVFAMAFDAGGRLLAGISGKHARLIRFDREPKVLFQSEKDRYIYAILLDPDGTIYFATGPEGHIYRLPPFGGDAELIYESRDKNVLSLAMAPDGSLLAGTDTRGLVYRIDVKSKTVKVIYDSKQQEITALAADEKGNLYVAASSVAAVAGKINSASQALSKSPGRPDTKRTSQSSAGEVSLATANTEDDEKSSPPSAPPPPPMPPGPKSASSIYRITPEGFVSEIFSDKVIFYALYYKDGQLLAATGNQGRLFGIDPATEQRAIVYQNEKSAQVTAIAAGTDGLMLALSNPPQVASLSETLAPKGTFTSDVIDAEQPSRWGKLQVDARIPEGCAILFTARSGNVEDPNDPTFSEWQPEKELTGPRDTDCPVARYLQYRLVFTRQESATGPVLREVAVAHSIPNLPPLIQAVQTQRSKDKQKPYIFQIGAKAEDENKDTLVFHYHFRRQDRPGWIKLEEDSTKPIYEWDTRTVEDGRYEVRVTADDKRSNSPSQALTGSRISDPIVVDNTPPDIKEADLAVKGKNLVLRFRAVDQFSAIGQAQFTIDSSEDWIGLLPEDLVFDTTNEWITLHLDDQESGDHVLALAVSDDPGNTKYQTFDFTIP